MKKYSPEIAEAIKTHIKENELRMVAFDEELGSFSFNMHLTAQLSSVNIIIRVGEDDFYTMAICPVRPDAKDRDMMAKMAEFVCRTNYGLKNGCFEFDFNDGELRYKCYIPCRDGVPSQELIRRSISIPASMLRRYSPGIIGVLYGNMDPENMVRLCEDDSTGRQVYNEMARSRREFLIRKLDSMATGAEKSGALPTFDEFLSMDHPADAAPDTPDAAPEPPAPDDAVTPVPGGGEGQGEDTDK